MHFKAVTICLLAGLLAGCSSVAVIKNPSPNDTGIRYWRPKPYLLVTPADATGRMVKIKMEYLPDYSEEYSVHPRGKKPPQVQLKDGWNLVAVGGPAPPPEKPEEAAAPAAPAGDPMKLPEYVVAATNVPIGYYESVFDGVEAKKHLVGWRYIGMSPLGGGLPNGGAKPDCPPAPRSALSGPLYGMVFFNGVMTFRQLDEIANNMTCPQYVKLTPDEPVAPAPRGTEMTPNRPTNSGTEMHPTSSGAEMRQDGADAAPEPPTVPSPPPASLPSTASPDSTSNAAPASAFPSDAKVVRASASAPPVNVKIPPPRIWTTPPDSH